MARTRKTRYSYDYDVENNYLEKEESCECAQSDLTELPPDMPINPEDETIKNIEYTQAYLKSRIGERVKIDFLIGTNSFVDKDGILKDVGVSYVVIEETVSGLDVLGDLYSIKFVTFFPPIE